MFRNRRFNLYMLRGLLTPTLLGLFLYTFILLMDHLFTVAEKALQKNLGADLTMQLILVGIPKLLVLSIPMSVLLGTLIAMGRLSADHEWVALQGAGHGPRTVFRPVFVHGFVAAVLCFAIYSVVVPRMNYAVRNLRGEIVYSQNMAADLRPRQFYPLGADRMMFVEEIKAGGQRRLEGVLLIERNPDDGSTSLFMAKYGDLYPAADRSGELRVDFYEAETRTYFADPDLPYRRARFAVRQAHPIPRPAFLAQFLDPPKRSAQDLTLLDLWGEMQEARLERERLAAKAQKVAAEKRSPITLVADRRLATSTVEFHQRIAMPVAALLFALLALPLGIAQVRSGKGAGFAMSLLVILVYWFVFVFARNQSVDEKIPPWLGPWAGNIVIGLWAVYAYWRLRYRSAGSFDPLLWSLAFLTGLGRSLSGMLRSGRSSSPAEATGPGGGTSDLVALGGTSNRFIGRLDRYVSLAYLRVLLFSLISAYLVFALVELQSLMDGALRTQQPLASVATYFQYFAPGVLRIVLPISCLIGAIVAFTLLARHSELTAMKASGIGMRRITYPVLALTLVLCGVLFAVEDRIAPAANVHAKTLKDKITGKAPRTYGPPAGGQWSFGADGNTLYNYRHYDPKTDEFIHLTILTLDRTTPRIVDHRFAEKARWDNGGWDLDGGWYRTFDPGGLERFDGNYRADLGDPGNLLRQKRRLGPSPRGDLPEQMSVAELSAEIRRLEESGYDITEMQVAYWGKFAHAFSPFVMVLLGLPFAFKVGRRGSLYGIGVALGLVLVYWATFAVFNALGSEAVLPAYLAAWAPNLLFGLLGTYLMLFIRT